MKLLNLILGFSLICFVATAQKISGRVIDTDGNPLTGASVIIKNSFIGTSTDQNGRFSLKTKNGNYTIIISFVGFQNLEKKVELNGDVDLGDLVLSKSLYMSEEVTVKATRSDEKAPVTYSFVHAEEIKKRNITQDIPYILELTPSFVATSEAGTGIGNTNYRIRGTDPSRINVTVNGIPLNDAESQTVFWVNMPDFASSVNNIQITRGVGTSTNGAASFGASMNFLTGTTETKPYAQIKTMGGNFNTLKESLLIGTGILDNGFSFDMRISNLHSDGYIENSFSDHQAATFTTAWRNKNSLVKFNLIHGRERTGISWEGVPKEMLEINRTYNPAGEYFDDEGNRHYYKDQTDNYIQTHYQLLFSHSFSKNLDLNASLFYTRGDGYYEEYKQNKKLSKYNLPNIQIPVDTIFSTNDTIIVPNIIITNTDIIQRKMMGNDFYGYNIYANYSLTKTKITFGTGWNKYDGDHFGKIIWMKHAFNIPKDYEWYKNTGIKTDFNVFLKINYEVIKNLYAYGDVQYRIINYQMSGIDDELNSNGELRDLTQEHNFNFFNPKLGIFYELKNNSNIYFSYAIAHREPTRTNFEDATGDPTKTPLPEKLNDYELGYNLNLQKFAANLNLFYMDYVNQLIPTGEKSNVGYDIMTNVPESYRTGVEISLGYKPISKLSINANITLSQNKIINFISYAYWDETYKSFELGTTDIAYSPNIIAAGKIDYSPISGLNISWISKYVGEQFFDNTSSPDRKIDDYFINNMQLDYTFSLKGFKEISLIFQINNIFNILYSNNAYGGYSYEQGVEKTWACYYPQAGRNFMGGITINF